SPSRSRSGTRPRSRSTRRAGTSTSRSPSTRPARGPPNRSTRSRTPSRASSACTSSSRSRAPGRWRSNPTRTSTSRSAARRSGRWSSRRRLGLRRAAAGPRRLAPKLHDRLGGRAQRFLADPFPSPAQTPPRSSGTSPVALLLAGVVIGGISGGAVATYLTSSGATTAAPANASSPGRSAAPSGSTLPLPPSSSVAQSSFDQQIIGVVQDLLPSIVTVINYASSGQPQSSGSGFVVDASRGYVVTNNHVVENVRDSNAGAAFDVVFSDNRKVVAKLVGRDPLTDLAVLQVPAQGLKAALLGNS